MHRVQKRLLKAGKLLHSNISYPESLQIYLNKNIEGRNYLIYGNTDLEKKIKNYIRENISFEATVKIHGSLLEDPNEDLVNSVLQRACEFEKFKKPFDYGFIIASQAVFDRVRSVSPCTVPLTRIDPSVLINVPEHLLTGGSLDGLFDDLSVISRSSLLPCKKMVAYSDNWRAAPYVVGFYLEYLCSNRGRDMPEILLIHDNDSPDSDHSHFLNILYSYRIPHKSIRKVREDYFEKKPNREDCLWIVGQHRAGFVKDLAKRIFVYKEDYKFVKEEMSFDKSRFFYYLNRSIEKMDISPDSDLFDVAQEWAANYQLYKRLYEFYFPNLRAIINKKKEISLVNKILRETYYKLVEYYNT